jgi:hypothetical protein
MECMAGTSRNSTSLTSAYHSRGSRRRIADHEGVREEDVPEEDHADEAASPDSACTDSQIDAQYFCMLRNQPGFAFALDCGAIPILSSIFWGFTFMI